MNYSNLNGSRVFFSQLIWTGSKGEAPSRRGQGGSEGAEPPALGDFGDLLPK